MEFNKIELLVDDILTTYKIDFDEDKMEEFKSKLLKYSIIESKRIIYDSFYYDTDKYCKEVLKLNYDKILGVYDSLEDSDGLISEEVKLSYYPFLYKSLFEESKINIFYLLLSYVLDKNDDKNIKTFEKIELVSEFISLISIEIVNQEQLNDIKNQMDIVTKISDKHKDEKKVLLNSMNNRLQRANKGTDSLNKLLILIDEHLNKSLSLRVENSIF